MNPQPDPKAAAAASAARISQFAEILVDPAMDARHKDFLTLLDTLLPQEAPSLRAIIVKLARSGRDVSFELAALNRRWGAIDPHGAMVTLDALPAKDRDNGEYEQVFFGWAAKDPVAAAAWLNAHPQHANYEQEFLGYVDGSASRDLNATTKKVIQSLEATDPLLPQALSRLALSARNRSLTTMKTWFDELPQDEASLPLKKAAAAEVYKLLPGDQFAANAAWIATQAAAPWRDNALIARHAGNYANSFPKAAMNWVQNTPPSPDKHIIIGVGEIVRAWEKRSLKDLQQWLSDNPTSPAFQQAAHDLAISQSKKNLDLAQQWASQVTQPVLRKQAQQAVDKAHQEQQPLAKASPQ